MQACRQHVLGGSSVLQKCCIQHTALKILLNPCLLYLSFVPFLYLQVCRQHVLVGSSLLQKRCI